ncbi:hypothetical protein [Streptomyces sp. NPDC004230]
MSQTRPTELMQSDAWRMFTTDRSKIEAYADDLHFSQGFVAAYDALGRSAAAVLRRHALLLIQPDCIARRMSENCLAFVEQHGFRAVHTMRVHLDPSVVDRLWFFQSESSTTDSKTIGDLVCGHSDSLLVVLRDEAPEPEVPASLRLTRLKGPARPTQRSAGHLRTLIGAYGPLVVLIHTSDEPLDMIRESAIIGGSSVQHIYSAMTDPDNEAKARLIQHIEGLHRETEAHDLDPQAALERLRDALPVVGSDAEGLQAARQVLSTLDAIQAGNEFLEWQPFADDLCRIGIDPRGWDPVLVGSRYVRLDIADVPRRFAIAHPEPLEPACDMQEFRAGGRA